jgi:HAD superfamily hydrolase (TIGR01662 family)
MIDTVTFDLWNTLIVNNPPHMEKYRHRRVENIGRIMEENGNRIEPAELLGAYLKGLDKCKESWRKNTDLSTEEQLNIFFDFLNLAYPEDKLRSLMPDFVEAYVSPILEDSPELVLGGKEILAELKKGGYKIGLICNTGTTPGATIRKLLKRLEMIDFFDVTTFSNELKIRKPDPRIFQETLDRLKSDPHESVHVGDLIGVDVLGAKNVGMIAVLLKTTLMSYDDILPDFNKEISPDYSIGELTDLKLVLDDLN